MTLMMTKLTASPVSAAMPLAANSMITSGLPKRAINCSTSARRGAASNML